MNFETKTNCFKKNFSAYYNFEGTSTSKIKSPKEVTKKQQESRVFLLFFLMIEGSGSGSIPLTNGSGSGRPKNMWIRIRNTAESYS
jgi:hypothetical protein